MAVVQTQTETTPAVARRDLFAAPDPVLLRVLLSGFLLTFIGFFVPWYYVSYAPPGGPVTVAGHLLTPFSYAYDGASGLHGGLLDGVLSTGTWSEQVLAGAAMTGIVTSALIIIFIATALSVPALAGLDYTWLRPLRYRPVKFLIDIVTAIAAVYVAASAVSFLLLVIGLARFGVAAQLAKALGNDPAGTQASLFLHISLGSGFWLVLLGLLIIVGALGKRFLVTLAVMLLGGLVLAYLAPSLIWPLLHTLGY